MILEKLEIFNYGPFSSPATLHLNPNITILIGRNDVGKSLVLDLIETLSSQNPAIDFNLSRWPKDL